MTASAPGRAGQGNMNARFTATRVGQFRQPPRFGDREAASCAKSARFRSWTGHTNRTSEP